MSSIRIRSIGDPFDTPDIARKAIDTVRQIEAMGLLPPEPVERLDAETFDEIADRVSSAGIATGILAALRQDLRSERPNLELLSKRLEQLNAVLASTPVPHSEWPRLADLFGVDRLSRLLGISPGSARRYKASSRTTPDEIAARLHFLAMVGGDLAGAYNDIGTRRWFERKRTALAGQSPSEILTGDWKPDDPEPSKVRELARSLVASPAT